VTPAGDERGSSVGWAEAAELPLCLLSPDMQHRRILDRAFARAGVTPRPAVETNSVSTLIGHARTGLPGVTAHSWLRANPLPPDLRAVPLVDPEIEYTIGVVTQLGVERTPVVAELLSMFAPLELDG
jgi:DNA-binding transcriptional LysR family regulator